MLCYFCKGDTHKSEDCKIFPTLRSRYSVLNYPFTLCLCELQTDKSQYFRIKCVCRVICDVCLQHHHIAVCPKRDKLHPMYSKNSAVNPLPLFKLDYIIIQRFLFLCNPIDKIKLQITCKYLFNLLPLDRKLYERFHYFGPPYSNLIFNKFSNISQNGWHFELESINKLAEEKHAFFNLGYVGLRDYNISMNDLKILAKSDPIILSTTDCQFKSDVVFPDFLNIFPFAYSFFFGDMNIPKTWIKDFLESKRNVSLFRIEITLREKHLDFDVNDLKTLLIKNEDLKIFFDLRRTNLGVRDKFREKMKRGWYLTNDSAKSRITLEYYATK